MAKAHFNAETKQLRQQFPHEFRAWYNMIRRCHCPKSDSWDSYGGRGIYVCTRWRVWFKAFLKDVGPKPQPYHLYSLDRIDNDGPYAPGNVRWTTIDVQANNKRVFGPPLISKWKKIEYLGRNLSIVDWSKIADISIIALKWRISKGWPPEKALTTPSLKSKGKLIDKNRNEYNTWCRIRHRCHTPTHPSYPKYGGRGIKVCERWLYSFADFLKDVGPRPVPTQPYVRYSLDRIDNDGDYEPGNVRWATDLQQARNTRHVRLITYHGETHCLSEWAEIYNITKGQLHDRLRRGWSFERAITEGIGERSTEKRLTLNGVTKTVMEWSQELGITYQAIDFRIRKGLPIEEVLSPHKKSLSEAGKVGGKNRWKDAARKTLTYKGVTRTIKEWAHHIGISGQSLRDRIDKGLPIESILAPRNEQYVNNAKYQR